MPRHHAAILGLACLGASPGVIASPRADHQANADRRSAQPATPDEITRTWVERPGELEFSGELIARPRQDLSPPDRARALALFAGRAQRAYPEVDEFVLRAGADPERGEAAPGSAERRLAADLLATGLFEYVWPNWRCYPAETIPDDPAFPDQWHLARIDAPLAWDSFTGSGAIIVGITDTGVDLDNPDLAPLRLPGFNAVDDRDEIAGGAIDDVNGHGTHVAGIAIAAGDNGTQGSGVCWNTPYMMVRVSNSPLGTAMTDDLLQGARWASDHGARVISTSFTGVSNPAINTTGAYIRARGGVYLYAAGNNNSELFSFDHPDVLVVGSTDPQDAKAASSNFGPALDLFAPGTDILSTCNNAPPCERGGTSMATSLAAGVLALAWGAHPGLSADEARDRLLFSCEDLGAPGEDGVFGWGRVDARRALEGDVPCEADFSGSADPASPGYGVPDGVIDASDLFFFLDLVERQDPRADFTGTVDPARPEYGVPDGVVDASDLFYFLDRFLEGC
ncbi:MAG: S8 family serine peptidase [Phycisphaerales bacterium]|nr:S8 family serine peptidase [Phycisphaerales bacterium]